MSDGALRRGPSAQTEAVALAVLGGSVLLAAILCGDGVMHMVDAWFDRAEYSHGVLIPFISLYLIWNARQDIRETLGTGSWWGGGVLMFGIALQVAGELSALFVVIEYAFLICVYGLVLAYVGWAGFKRIFVPLAMLAFMIPLPDFLYNNLSAKLQLLSSEIGVAVIRSFGLSVFLEGNVIDLGSYKLQVVEACNGLRYLFPLMTLGFIVAYLYRAEWWKRLIVFLSTIPITVLMNSFRIGVIGVMVNKWGQSMAEGFLHDFEGWVIFMACFAVLFVEMWLLMRLTGDKRSLDTIFGLEIRTGTGASLDSPVSKGSKGHVQLSYPLMFAMSAVIGSLILKSALPERKEIAPGRMEFSGFPLALGEWKGQRDQLEKIYIDELKFTDYALINYRNSTETYVNFYSAYYASQRKGESVHSPRSCLPGGGWEIESLSQINIPGADVRGQPVRVNRALISYGDQKQLVYYWFQQRGRVLTNEYLVKWFIFWDALTRNRTDGSLVRLTTPLKPGQDVSELDAALGDFIRQIAPILGDFIPN